MKMNTSALVAELLLGGGLVQLVGLLYLDHLANGRVLAWLLGLQGTGAALVASAAVILAYYFGSLLNALSWLVFRPVESRVKKKISGTLPAGESLRRRLKVIGKNAELHEHVDELYAQIRVLRGASVAFALLMVVLVVRQQPAGSVKGFLVGAAAVGAAGSILSTVRIMRSYFRVLQAAWDNMMKETVEEGVGSRH